MDADPPVYGVKIACRFTPDGKAAQTALDEINRSTLGRLLTTLKQQFELCDGLENRFASALQARNRLNHGFFEKHNFRIQTDDGRDAMIADLEDLHNELFSAWQIASAMTALAMQGTQVANAGNDAR